MSEFDLHHGDVVEVLDRMPWRRSQGVPVRGSMSFRGLSGVKNSGEDTVMFLLPFSGYPCASVRRSTRRSRFFPIRVSAPPTHATATYELK